MTGATVREAGMEDAGELARLMGVLGYPATEEQMRGRLGRILGDPAFATFLALDAGGRPIGMVGVMTGHSYNHDAPYARILALVVDEAARGTGAGAALVRRAEEWARAAGAGDIHLTTASHREGAHAFYERVGYQGTGRRYRKPLRG